MNLKRRNENHTCSEQDLEIKRLRWEVCLHMHGYNVTALKTEWAQSDWRNRYAL